MNLENDKWNIADEEFSLWMNGNKQEGNLDLTDILKSTFLAFRQKQIERLTQFCKTAFEYYIEQERKIAEIARKPIFEDNEIRFRIADDLSESEKRARTSEKNKRVI